MAASRYTALRWFRATVVLGFLANLGFALPALFAPRWLESLGAYGQTNTLHWLQNVGILLVIVTMMYIPVIRDPFRYLFITILVVAGRFAAGSLFLIGLLFLNFPEGLRLLAGTDLTLSSVQALLLYRVLMDGDPRSRYPA
jgi:hypothetical protein